MIIHHNCAVKVINASKQQHKKHKQHMMKNAQKTDGFCLRHRKRCETKYKIRNLMLHELNEARTISPQLMHGHQTSKNVNNFINKFT